MFKSKIFRIFIRQYLRNWRYFVFFPIGTVIISVLGLWTPWVFREVLDNVIPNHQVRKLFLLILSVVLVSVVSLFIGGANNILVQYGFKQVLYDVRRNVIRFVTRIPTGKISEIGMGETLTRLSGDISNLSGFISNTTINIVSSMTIFISSVAFLAYLDNRLLLACLAVVPLEILTIFIFKNKIFRTSLAARNTSANVTAFITEILLGIPTIRSLRMDKAILKQLRYYQQKSLAVFKVSQLVILMTSLCKHVISEIPTIIILGYGGLLVIKGKLSIGSIIAFQQLIFRIYGPLNSIIEFLMSAIQAKVPLKRMDEILGDYDFKPEVSYEAIEKHAISNNPIHIREVSYSYDGKPVLTNINLDIPAQKNILLIGSSGCGKTTLAKLMTRVIYPDKGSIFLGEDNLAKLSEEILYRSIAIVDQEPVFFSCPITENLSFAAPDASNQDIEKAIWTANLEGFIQQLPEGLNTKLNDRGTMISGGELKRLALARAILKMTHILILDETTTGVSPYTEKVILERIRVVNPKVTIIVISHRMTLVEKVDNLVFMENGQIVATGSHQQLLSVCPSYRKLYHEADLEVE